MLVQEAHRHRDDVLDELAEVNHMSHREAKQWFDTHYKAAKSADDPFSFMQYLYGSAYLGDGARVSIAPVALSLALDVQHNSSHPLCQWVQPFLGI